MRTTRLDTTQLTAQLVLVTQTRTSEISRKEPFGAAVRAVLQELGAALDMQRPLVVHDQGRIALGREFPTSQEKENGDGRQRTRGSAARPRKGAARRQGPAGRPRQAGAAARFGVDLLRAAYEVQVTALAEAYPSLQTYVDEDGMWLLAKSAVIADLDREATFLVALPYRPGAGPRAWAFWTDDGPPRWIGPRHTNFHDGSVCAFSPKDGAWHEGDDLRTLLDLYSVWALRHLYLEAFGRWPGRQYALLGGDPRVSAYYRIIECKDDELCGCGSETHWYADCCKPSDQRLNLIQLAATFSNVIRGGFATRQPPQAVVDAIAGSGPPPIKSVHLQLGARPAVGG